MRAYYLKRREAIQVLNEIGDLIPHASVVNCCVVKPCEEFASFGEEDCVLQIKTPVSKFVLERIRSIVSKHELTVARSGEYLTISEVPGELEEILA